MITLTCLLIAICIKYVHKTKNIFEILALSISHFILLFIVCSSFLFLFFLFRFINVIIFEIVICLLYIVCNFNKVRSEIKNIFVFEEINYRDILIPIGIFLFILPFTLNKAEYLGMGRDEGVHQTEAIAFMNGYTSIEHKNLFDEYKIIYDKYKDCIDNLSLGGYNPIGRRSDLKFPKNPDNLLQGHFHGLHSFSALLGFAGFICGIENMSVIQTIILFCCIILFYYALLYYKISRDKILLITFLFAFNPLIIWISQNCYSETLILLSLTLYIYYLSKTSENKEDIIGMGISISYFSFSHVIFLIFFPVFWLINTYKSIKTENKIYVLNNAIIAISLFISTFIFSRISVQYFYDNLRRLYIKSFITIDNTLVWIFLFSFISFLLSLFIYKFRTKIDIDKIKKYLFIFCKIIASIAIIYTVYYWIKISFGIGDISNSRYFIYLKTYFGKGLYFSFEHISIFCLIILTGGFFIYSLFLFFLNKEKNIPLYLLFFYFSIIYPGVLKKDVYLYFYYARYFVYVIPFILLFVFCLNIKKKFLLNIFIVISILIMSFFNINFLQYKDNTLITWNCLIDLSKNIEKKSAVIFVNDELRRSFSMSLKFMSDISVFPMFDDLKKEEELLTEYYDNVYVICDIPNNLLLNDVETDDDLIYKNFYFKSINDLNLEEFPNVFKINKFKNNIYLFKCNSLTNHVCFDLYNGIRIKDVLIDNNKLIVNSGGGIVYGPYIALSKGKYTLNMIIDVVKYKDSLGKLRLTDNKGKILISEYDLKDFKYDKKTKKLNIFLDFELKNDVKELEFVVFKDSEAIIEIELPYYLSRRFEKSAKD